MKQLVLACILLLSALTTSADSGDTDVYETAYVNKHKYEMWFEACDYTPYTCVGVPVPKVVLEEMRPGLLGQYRGGDTVYIRKGLTGVRLKEVLLHEMIHYLQKQVGGLTVPGPAKEICAAEEEAFTQTDKWLIDNGYDFLVVGKNWWKPYSHCWQWYDPKWPSYSAFDKFIWTIGIT